MTTFKFELTIVAGADDFWDGIEGNRDYGINDVEQMIINTLQDCGVECTLERLEVKKEFT